MSGPFPPWLPRPTVGVLLELLEENYRLLLCLAPDLRRLSGNHRAPGRGLGGATDLHLDVIEQAPYTSVVRLTYRFPTSCPAATAGERPTSWLADPDARLRVCHDACQVEVIALRQTMLPLLGADRLPTLDSKWKANWFLGKWLGYCVREDYRFFPARERPRQMEAADPAAAC